jgi:CRP-like cAMP-binding protein
MTEDLQIIRIAAGERVFSQGDTADTSYLVLEGRIALTQAIDGRAVDICTLSSGEVLGEMAVLEGGRRAATAIAVEDCQLAPVNHAAFQNRLGAADAFLRALLDSFIKNIRTSPRLFLRRPRSFRDHVRQMNSFSWNLRRFAGRLDDVAMADDVLDILDRLDVVLDDLANVAELTADKRHDLIADEEMNGVDFSDVVGSEGRRRL